MLKWNEKVNDPDLTFINKQRARDTLRFCVAGLVFGLISGCGVGSSSGSDISFCPLVEEGAVAIFVSLRRLDRVGVFLLRGVLYLAPKR